MHFETGPEPLPPHICSPIRKIARCNIETTHTNILDELDRSYERNALTASTPKSTRGTPRSPIPPGSGYGAGSGQGSEGSAAADNQGPGIPMWVAFWYLILFYRRLLAGDTSLPETAAARATVPISTAARMELPLRQPSIGPARQSSFQQHPRHFLWPIQRPEAQLPVVFQLAPLKPLPQQLLAQYPNAHNLFAAVVVAYRAKFRTSAALRFLKEGSHDQQLVMLPLDIQRIWSQLLEARADFCELKPNPGSSYSAEQVVTMAWKQSKMSRSHSFGIS